MKSFLSSDIRLYAYISSLFHTFLISNLFAYFCHFWSLFPFTSFLKALTFWSVSMYYPVKFVSWTVHELIDNEMFVKIQWNSKCQITGLTPLIDRFHKLNFDALLDYHWDSEELVFEVAVKFTKAVKFIVLRNFCRCSMMKFPFHKLWNSVRYISCILHHPYRRNSLLYFYVYCFLIIVFSCLCIQFVHSGANEFLKCFHGWLKL